MAMDQAHPSYGDYADEWAIIRDTIAGALAVKDKGEVYLPMPSGFRAQSDAGAAMYRAYGTRGQFPEIISPAIGGMVGIIHQSEFQISLPDSMAELWERATRDGMSLEAFHRRITRELLSTGRYGVLAEAPEQGGMPYLAGYTAESIINWSPERDMFVLDESGKVRDGFDWTDQKKFRALLLEDGRYVQRVEIDGEEGEEVQPQALGARSLDEIPFVVMSARDVTVDPEKPPLIGVARAALAIYRLDADYRHQLYMSGQETLVIINGDAPEAVGAGVVLVMKGSEDLKPDAKYVGPQGTGIEAHKIAIEDDWTAAAKAGAQLFDNQPRTQESGEARKLRFGAETASLVSIAQASAAGLEKALRYCARMTGAKPEDVIVKPPANLLATPMSAQDITAVTAAWRDGAISYTSLFEVLQRGQVVSVERDSEAELKLIDEEAFRREEEIAAALPRTPAPVDDGA